MAPPGNPIGSPNRGNAPGKMCSQLNRFSNNPEFGKSLVEMFFLNVLSGTPGFHIFDE
jgi:hypothetical protein